MTSAEDKAGLSAYPPLDWKDVRSRAAMERVILAEMENFWKQEDKEQSQEQDRRRPTTLQEGQEAEHELGEQLRDINRLVTQLTEQMQGKFDHPPSLGRRAEVLMQ